MATMLKHVRAKVPPPRNASKETHRVVLMGLRKDRSKRIQTAGRFAELIGECIGHLRAVKEGRITDSTSMPVSRSNNTGPLATAPGMPLSTGAATFPGQASERRGVTIALALGAVALGLVALAVFGDFTKGTSESDAPADPAIEGAVDAEVSPYESFPNNRALVRTNIEQAKVFVDGEEQCETPCEITVPVGDGKTHEIRLKKDGYVDVIYNWRPMNVGEQLPPLPDMKPL